MAAIELTFMRDAGSRKSPFCDPVLAHKHDSLLLLGIPDKILQEFDSAWDAGDSVMRAERHHPAAGSSFRVEDIEIILQIFQIGGVRAAGESKRTMSLLRIV